jgi:pimeloyl-ACP methyl ester carboxylesterase
MIANPTVVLVHGAFADASGFAGIIRELQSQGLEVRAPMNPLRGLGFDADAIARYTTSIDGPILLAGHSYGGAVISEAATAIKTAAALVYLSAFALDENESCASLLGQFPPSLLASTSIPSPYDAPGAAGGPDLFIKIGDFQRTFCADLPDDQAATMAVSQPPELGGAVRARHHGWLEELTDVVPGVRTRQRAPTRRPAIHGQEGRSRHRIGGRLPRSLYRPPTCCRRTHPQGPGDSMTTRITQTTSAAASPQFPARPQSRSTPNE